MKQTISKSDFRDAFSRMGRKDNFSYEGLGHLYDYLEEVSEDYELDVIELCCEFEEDTINNVLAQYGLEDFEQLQEETNIVWFDDENVIYAQY